MKGADTRAGPDRASFQLALNLALSSYLEGKDLDRTGRLLFPLGADERPVRDSFAAKLRPLAAATAGEWRYDAPGVAADLLAAATRRLAAMRPPPGPLREFRPAPWRPDRHGRSAPLVRVRDRLRAAAGGSGLRILLHGSCASLDFTGYSDVDLLVVVPTAVATEPARLRACRRRFARAWKGVREFDPLQHHGPFVLTEVDLEGYPDPLFPAVILEALQALDEAPPAITARIYPAPELAAGRFGDLARRFLDADLRRGRTDAYRLKSDLSVFMLLPALWCQARGLDRSKKHSFPEVYARLSPRSVAAFRRAAAIRDAWRYREPRRNSWLRRLWWNPFVPAVLDVRAARAPDARVRDHLTDGFLEDAKGAVRELLELPARAEATHADGRLA